jgi:putative colanic acid biosynthesis acetyltransferase WcaF
MDYQKLNLFSVPDHFRGKPVFIVQTWWFVQATLFAWSPQFMYGWRRFLLRLFGAKISDHVLIRPTAKITYPWKVTIGEYSWIGDDVVLYSLGEIQIGSHTVISQNTYICSGSHDFNRVTFDIYEELVKIGNQVWVASDVFISPGVTVGDGTIVGVRSLVLKDLPAGKICYGSPAEVVKDRPIPS